MESEAQKCWDKWVNYIITVCPRIPRCGHDIRARREPLPYYQRDCPHCNDYVKIWSNADTLQDKYRQAMGLSI